MSNQTSNEFPIDPMTLIQPRRKINGMSAILVPFHEDDSIDWDSLAAHVTRTVDAGLVPAVNMDTGYANLLDGDSKTRILEVTQSIMAGRPFVAGAWVGDDPDSEFNFDAYREQIDLIEQSGGTPIIFQSYGLAHGTDEQIVSNYQQLASHCGRFLAFELGTMFAPFGNIYSLDVFKAILGIKECVGAKHSSLQRKLEWQRLAIRNEFRPDFQVLTGNDLAIDMVIYGSDYLLGLSTFCPDLFAKRDEMWANGNPDFYQLNDTLQYLGHLAFRNPTSAYKHNAAMFLKLRGWIETDRTHPNSPTRPTSDRDILIEIGRQLNLDIDA